ncbi:MAG: acyl-CoA dehydrogenase family protein, partial [bacterium]
MPTQNDFSFGEEEQILRDHARRFLEERMPVDVLRALVASDAETAYESTPPPAPYDAAVWQQIVDLGWPGLAVPVEAGGTGMSTVALVALCEEVGRSALPSPLAMTLLTTCVLRAAESTQGADAMRRITGGASA